MEASIRRKFGSPNQIKVVNIERPIAKDNEVLIKVHATTVNRTDCAILTAQPFIMRFVLGLFRPRKAILGTDFAGEVVSIGKKVKSFNINDKVFGFNDTGSESQAEYITQLDSNLFSIPENIDYKHAAALLQFVKQYNVKITATCNTKNIELIKSLGANKIYDYTKEDFTADKEKYDYIFDAVGKSTFWKCKSLLKKQGIYISSELGPYAQNLYYAIATLISNNKKVIFQIPYNSQKTIPYIMERLIAEKFKPLLDREYSLENISLA